MWCNTEVVRLKHKQILRAIFHCFSSGFFLQNGIEIYSPPYDQIDLSESVKSILSHHLLNYVEIPFGPYFIFMFGSVWEKFCIRPTPLSQQLSEIGSKKSDNFDERERASKQKQKLKAKSRQRCESVER